MTGKPCDELKPQKKHRMINKILVNCMMDGSEKIQVSYHMTVPLSKDPYI